MTNAELLKTAAESLRGMSQEITDLKAKIRNFEKRDEAEKLAHELANKNLISSNSVDEIVDEWIENDKDLNIIKEAAKISEQKSFGSTFDGLVSGGSPRNPDDALTSWILK